MKYKIVSDILESSAINFADKVAIIDRKGSLTYAELHKEVQILYKELIKAGLSQGKHVGLQLENSRDFIIALFAASKTLAVVIPLGVNLKKHETTALQKELSLDYLIRPLEAASTTESNSLSVLNQFRLEIFEDSDGSKASVFDGAAFIRPSSGTTGRSKGVVITHQSVFERVENALQSLKLDSNDRILWVLPMAYHFIVSVIAYVKCGAAIVVCNDPSSETLLATADEHRVTALYASPTHFILLADDESSKCLPPLKWAICTAGGIPATLNERFFARQKNILRQVYGLIEVGLPIGNLFSDNPSENHIGKVLPGYEAKIFDEQGCETIIGNVGELAIRGSGLFAGYLTPFQNRNNIMREGWFYSGDLASLDASGNFKIVGRKKSMMIVAGNKVFSEEVETVLNDHPNVKLSRVYGEKHELTGECICADVIVEESTATAASDLKKFCKQRLAGYKVPVHIKFVERIDLTASGKVMRYEPSVQNKAA